METTLIEAELGFKILIKVFAKSHKAFLQLNNVDILYCAFVSKIITPEGVFGNSLFCGPN